jgi:hypothetical protein
LQVAFLGIVRGKSEDTIERVSTATVGDQLARIFSWNGMKEKKPFKGLWISDVIYDITALQFLGIIIYCEGNFVRFLCG